MPDPAVIADLRAAVGAIETDEWRVPPSVDRNDPPLIRAMRAEIGSLSAGDTPPTLPFGVPELDAMLPGGGLRLGALHEFYQGGTGKSVSYAAAASVFVGAIAGRVQGRTLWITPATDLYPLGLSCIGLELDRQIIVEVTSASVVLKMMEDALRIPGLGCVVGETPSGGHAETRRLQLAAHATGVTALLIRRWAKQEMPSAAMTRWRIGPSPSPRVRIGLARARLRVELLRCRGRAGGTLIMEFPDAKGHLALAAHVRDRSVAQAQSCSASSACAGKVGNTP